MRFYNMVTKGMFVFDTPGIKIPSAIKSSEAYPSFTIAGGDDGKTVIYCDAAFIEPLFNYFLLGGEYEED